MVMLGPTTLWELVLEVFLVAVFASSAWQKRDPVWPEQVVAFRLWPEPVARVLASLIGFVEATVAGVLVIACQAGFLLAGTLFLAYSFVLALALRRDYHGPCGCSAASGPVSRLKMWRALIWGGITFAVGVSYFAVHWGLPSVVLGSLVVSIVLFALFATTYANRFGISVSQESSRREA